MNEKEIENLRYLFWRPEFVKQHSLTSIKDSLNGLFTFSSIKHGTKGQGDVILVNCIPNENNNYINLLEYLSYCRDIKKIEQIGIYTNIYFGSKFYTEMVKEICK